MRHRKAGAKLGISTSHRRAMLRNMVTSLFDHGRVITTTVKAKALRPMAEKLVTLAKRGDLHARRQAMTLLMSKTVAQKLFGEIKDRFMDRAGGYTSIIKIGPRRGDAAEMSVLSLVNPEEMAKAQKKAKKKAPPKKTEQKASPAQGPKADSKAKPAEPAPTASEPAPIPVEAVSETPAVPETKAE